MSSMVVDSVESAQPPAAKRRRRAVLVVAAVIVLLVGAALTTFFATRHLDRQYGPIGSGNAAGPISLKNIVFAKDGFSMSLSTAPGASAEFVEFVRNDGAHSVEITSIPTNAVVSAVRWSTYRMTSRSNLGAAEPLHHFPAIVPAHGQLRLVITIHRPPSCQHTPARTAGGSSWTGALSVHWKSLLHTHISIIRFLGDYRIELC